MSEARDLKPMDTFMYCTTEENIPRAKSAGVASISGTMNAQEVQALHFEIDRLRRLHRQKFRPVLVVQLARLTLFESL